MRKRPDSASAHFNLGYVLRYAGLLEDSARECDTALALDPRNPAWRSCAETFTLASKYDRAIEYARLDGASRWAATIEMDIRVRQGQREQAIALVPRAMGTLKKHFSPVCLDNTSAAADKWKAILPSLLTGRDPEPKYYQAGSAAFCGQDEPRPQAASRVDRRKFPGQYPAMDKDPLLARIRSHTEFASIRSLAIERQKQIVEPGRRNSPRDKR